MFVFRLTSGKLNLTLEDLVYSAIAYIIMPTAPLVMVIVKDAMTSICSNGSKFGIAFELKSVNRRSFRDYDCGLCFCTLDLYFLDYSFDVDAEKTFY